MKKERGNRRKKEAEGYVGGEESWVWRESSVGAKARLEKEKVDGGDGGDEDGGDRRMETRWSLYGGFCRKRNLTDNGGETLEYHGDI
ncbi:hypothetical protein SLEP1_g54980 [Rubroshorea leprosula]|uniref:Uncharacterized protein n=1 Tax=Rubroshorea leprosula TaxID=152421 RepID=A0AAV5MF60_9ROSI|nr:hypothetical protein SLEP1_g54980 [Rubroshorea leprosula]